MKRGAPISPEDIPKKKPRIIPPEVFDAFNELILLNYSENSAAVLQKNVVKLIKKKLPDVPFDIHWLDVEDFYREKGWRVKYDKPAYCESYDSCFYFYKK